MVAYEGMTAGSRRQPIPARPHSGSPARSGHSHSSPRVLLLTSLGALDAKIGERCADHRQVQREPALRTVLVTQDQEEAFALARHPLGVMITPTSIESGSARTRIYTRMATRSWPLLGAENLLSREQTKRHPIWRTPCDARAPRPHTRLPRVNTEGRRHCSETGGNRGCPTRETTEVRLPRPCARCDAILFHRGAIRSACSGFALGAEHEHWRLLTPTARRQSVSRKEHSTQHEKRAGQSSRPTVAIGVVRVHVCKPRRVSTRMPPERTWH